MPGPEAPAVSAEAGQEKKWSIVDPESYLQGRSPPVVDDNGVPAPLSSFLIRKEPEVEVVPYCISRMEMKHIVELAEGFWPIPRQAIEMVALRFRQTVVVERIEKRLAAITGLPVDHLDRVCVVRYMPCNPAQQRPLHGPGSTKAVFAWLGDLPQDCGASCCFPGIGVACKPCSGTALIWPDCKLAASTASNDPEEPPPMVTQFGLDVVPPNEASGMMMFGLLAFFKASPVRSLIEPTGCFKEEAAATVPMPEVDNSQEEGAVQKFSLESQPPLTLVPKFCRAGEVEHLLNLSPTFREAHEGKLPAVLGLLPPGCDNVVSALEARLVAIAGVPFHNLGQLRVVASGRTEGYCNRGCGSRTVYVCLSEKDEVFFPYIGLKVSMCRGDAILWPNVHDSGEGKWTEDVRAVRCHLQSSVGVEAIFCDWSVRVPQVLRPPPLELGSELKLSNFSFKITEAIGMGSFGMVWGAQVLEEPESSDSVVVKEIICQGAENANSAREQYEYKLLQMLTDAAAADSIARCALSRIPSFVDSQCELVGPSMVRMRFAMKKVPGVTMDNFILKCLKERQDSKSAGKDVTSREAQQQQFALACHFARELVSQLAPTLAHISKLAIHRDVNSHNVMVDGDLENPKFYLVDFGLAVDNELWFGPMSKESFHMYDIGGDCRYWPVGGWLMFMGGYDELRKYPVLELEYSKLLDIHSLGVIAMQGLAALSPTPTQQSAGDGKQNQAEDSNSDKQQPAESEESKVSSSSSSVIEEDGLSNELRQLVNVWNRYWYEAHRNWEYLFNAFRTTQDFGPVKIWCAQNAVHNTVAHQMSWIRQALLASLSSSSVSEIADARPLFRALLELISAGLCEDPPDASNAAGIDTKRPRSWKAVCDAIENRSTLPEDGSTKQETLKADD